MAFIDDLLESGGNYIVQRASGGASFSPVSDKDADLKSFQSLVRRLREHDGDGFQIFKEHPTADRSEDLVDLVMVTIDGDRV
ncbi:MAG: hypothetical protein JWR80_8826 [Bradyrhizobium sp.]|nr:hypothetical protein [Bradyrhizobium sp.]